MKVKSESEVARSCPTLSDPMDCSLPGSSGHRILQARVQEWFAIAFSSYLARRYGFSSSRVGMWEFNHKEGWALNNWSVGTVVLEKTLESPLNSKIKPVNPKGNQPWILIGSIDAESEVPILWPPHVRSWLMGKDTDAGKDWGQKRGSERGCTGWMASPTQWVWASSGRWWRTGKPRVLQFSGIAELDTP